MLSNRRFMKSLSQLSGRDSRFGAWLHTILMQMAVSNAYQTFAEKHPRWAASLFDEYFLRGQAAPLLGHYAQTTELPSPCELAKAWFDQFGPFMPASARANNGEVTKVAADFLQTLNAELCCLSA